ncbi:MAG: hypothetical protein ACD_62C00565G0002 [uncultured bacterium]|nr:MAG: hypothetical protein ACD_62C00565G0002 [uncultured bacterium]
MLQAVDLTKSYTSQRLFDNVTFTLSKGEKVGLVGRNGSGKSTLFKLILHEEEPDTGKIVTPIHYRVGALKQHLKFTHATAVEEVCSVLPPDEAHEHYRAEKILSGLGFAQNDWGRSPLVFSGGFQIRICLAKLLIDPPDLLLLDEPTNYLDIISIRWLKNFLRAFSGEVILITHDRGFMDDVITHTMGIHRNKIIKTLGTTEKYYSLLAEEEELYVKQQQKQAQTVKHMQNYIDRFRASARRASQAQVRIKRLAKMQDLVDLEQEDALRFRFNTRECPGKVLLEINNYAFAYPDMAQDLIRKFGLVIRKNDRIAIIGKNGTGKSTLLNLLAGELVPHDGTSQAHPLTEKAFFGQMNIDRLNENNTVEDEVALGNPLLSYNQIKSICGLMMFDHDFSTKRIRVLSGGERSRVLLGKILANPVNLLLLDEPTNHLDQESIEGLLQGLEVFEGAVLMVTHSEMILQRFAKRLIVFQNDEILVFEGTYDDFLRRVGWSTENTQENGDETQGRLSKKEIRQQRAKQLTQKSRVLKPLQTQVNKLEHQILKLEKEVNAATQHLIEASASNDVPKQVRLSKKLKQDETQIEILYSELDQVTREYESALAELDE